MSTPEIQSFKQIGSHLRKTREMRDLTLLMIAGSCGLTVAALAQVERGEALGFKQGFKGALSNAEVYAKALDLEYGDLRGRHTGATKKHAQTNDEFIPFFLRKK